MTRETVAADTPAARATSSMEIAWGEAFLVRTIKYYLTMLSPIFIGEISFFMSQAEIDLRA